MGSKSQPASGPSQAAAAGERLLLAAVVAAALLARLVSVAAMDRPLVYDEHDYDALGWTLASTGAYASDGRPTAYRPVGYPAYVAAVYAVAGHAPRAVRVTQAFLDAAVVLLLFAALRRRHRRAAFGAAIGWAFFPPAIVYAGLLYSETLFAFLLVAAACLLVAEPGRSHGYRLLVGLLFGVLALVKPAALIVIAFLPFLVFHGSRRWRRSLALLAGILLVIAPWAWRNARAVGVPTLATASSTAFLIGNHPNATGGYAPDVPASMRPAATDEAGAAREADRAARIYIQTHPGRFLAGIARRWAHLLMGEGELAVTAFHASPERRETSYRRKVGELPPAIVLALWIPYALVLLIGLLGVLSRPRDPFAGVLLALVFAWLIVHGVTHAGGRYHAPWMPFLVAFAAEYLFAPPAPRRLSLPRRLLWIAVASICLAGWWLEAAHYR